ncbi:MAG TPA: DUF4190 domain-containing protein [Pseudonocardiaceae bacterium]|jgi:hypothetical protein
MPNPPVPQYQGGGYPAPANMQAYPVAQPQPSNGVAIGGMVTGIVGIVFGWVPIIGFILGAVAVILSGVGINNANKKHATGRGMAIAGLVCGILAVLFGLLWITVIGAAASVGAVG